MRRGVELGALLIAVLSGYAIASVVGAPALVEPAETPAPGFRTEMDPLPSTTTAGESTTSPLAGAETYLVWSTGGLTPKLVAGLESTFPDLSVVGGDVVELDPGTDGWVVPLDALAIDPEDHTPFDSERSLGALGRGAVVLGESSAAFRELGLGDRLSIAGSSYEVVAIAPDEVVAAAEIVFAKDDETAPVATDRFALVSTDLPRAEFEEVVRSLYDGPAPLRIRSEGETPWLRHGDAVLPQIFIKEALGEFSYRDRSGSEFSQDPEFLDEHIVSAEVPILGRITCHATVVAMLRSALGQLVDEGLAHLVDPSQFAGCWNPRFIRTITGELAGISRHAWGAAVDINAASNPMGSAGSQDHRLVEIMQKWGFTWGGDWLVPDSMHFEYGVPPGS
ncbi:MAG TPA: M15 family metallopeptidase [Acidimicrobiia bacterium]|nr:M15 family metallopeptidase [Acidimicrobiia bacterium]